MQRNGLGQNIVGNQTGCTTWLRPRFSRARPAKAMDAKGLKSPEQPNRPLRDDGAGAGGELVGDRA